MASGVQANLVTRFKTSWNKTNR